jgi:hypothetical protein
VDFETALGFATNAGNLRLELQDYLEDSRNRKASNNEGEVERFGR